MTESTPKPSRWMKYLGLRRREGKYLPFVPTVWGWVVIVGMVGVIGSLAFAEYSMQPDFCRSCHIMEPYYKAWHESSHKDVPCTYCHFEPGIEKTLYGKWQASSQAVKYITNTYGSKPHAEVRDSSCMRDGCHERRLLEGKVAWEVPSVRGGHVTIRFDHAPHLQQERRGKQLRCVSCHSQIVQGQHIVVTLDTCFLCHFKGFEHGRHEETLGGCKACHGSPKSAVRLPTGDFEHAQYVDRGVACENCHADVVKGDGAVPRQTCWNCHNQQEQIGKYGQTNLLHQQHVSEHKVECSSCHIKIEHNLSAAAGLAIGTDQKPRPGDTCAQCHEKMHGGPVEMYRGVGGRGVPDMPSPMSRARVSCIACHKSQKQGGGDAQFTGQTFLAVQQSCDGCHGNKYEGVLEQWKSIVATRLADTEAVLAEARKAADAAYALTSEDKLRVARLLDDADYNVRFVKLGHGVHNVNYATALLSTARERCERATQIMGGRP